METNKLQYIPENTFFVYNGKAYIKARQVVTMGEYRVLVKELANDTLIMLPATLEVMVT
jgi:hypothetical protein